MRSVVWAGHAALRGVRRRRAGCFTTGKACAGIVSLPSPVSRASREGGAAPTVVCPCPAFTYISTLPWSPSWPLATPPGPWPRRRDPLAGLQFRTTTFNLLGRALKALADELCGGRVVFLLEGGYDLKALGDSVVSGVWQRPGQGCRQCRSAGLSRCLTPASWEQSLQLLSPAEV